MRIAGEPDPSPWRPLGERVPKAPPPKPDWTPLLDNPAIERNRRDGHLRTNLPLPKGNL